MSWPLGRIRFVRAVWSLHMTDLRARLLADKFWSKVEKGKRQDCWLWNGSRDNRNYGIYCINNKRLKAHRVSWMLHNNKDFPAHLEGAHQCDNPPCVNPHHIKPMTHRENIQQAFDRGLVIPSGTKVTHCKQGHELAGANLVASSTRGWRRCRICSAAACKRYRAKRKALAASDERMKRVMGE